MFLAYIFCSHLDIGEILQHSVTYFDITRLDLRQSHYAEDCTTQNVPPSEASRLLLHK